MNVKTATVVVCIGAFGALGAATAHAQVARVQPGLVERVMPDFSLSGLDGRVVALSQLKGRAVIIVFPRGKVAEADGSDPHWCQLCHYQYAELAELEKTTSFRAALKVDVLFVLPYGRDEAGQWASIIPKQVATVDRWRQQVKAWRDLLRPGRWPSRTAQARLSGSDPTRRCCASRRAGARRLQVPGRTDSSSRPGPRQGRKAGRPGLRCRP